MGCLSIAGLPPVLNLPVPIYTPGWREALWWRELSVLPKNTTQCPQPGLAPGPLDPESSALTVNSIIPCKEDRYTLKYAYQWCSFCHIGFESLFVCSYETESSQVGNDKYTKGNICIIFFFSGHIVFSFHRSLLLGTCNYLSHSIFTNQSFFRLNLLQIQTTAGTSVTTHKHELNERWKKKNCQFFPYQCMFM